MTAGFPGARLDGFGTETHPNRGSSEPAQLSDHSGCADGRSFNYPADFLNTQLHTL